MAEMKSRFQHLLVVECHTTDIKWYLHLLDSLGSFLDKNKSIYSNIISLLSCNWLLDDSLESSAVPFLVLPVWTSLYIFADQTQCLYFWKVQIIQQFITWLPGLWFIQRVLNYWVPQRVQDRELDSMSYRRGKCKHKAKQPEKNIEN